MKTPIRVLLIEDEPAQAWLVRDSLNSAGGENFELHCAEDLADGLIQLAGWNADVLLLDLSLPDSTGITTFQKVKKSFPNIPVVALTGLEDEQVGLQLVQAGAQDYLLKSQVTSALLCRALRYAVERKRADAEREKLISELKQALAEVKTLSGLLPICSHCKKVRNDRGYWSQIETYLMEHSDAQFTHGLCPDCIQRYFPIVPNLKSGGTGSQPPTPGEPRIDTNRHE